MGRTFEISGDSLSRLLYALQLVGLGMALVAVALSLDGPASVPLALLFLTVMVATLLGLWRTPTDDTGTRTAEDITYDPVADPGQAAKERWERAVRRLPDDERE
jgi:hypothetical protein